MFKKEIIIRKISANVCGNKIEKAKDYIKKSVDDYCERNQQTPFSVHTLFGGVNRDWRGTDLQSIFYYYDNLKLDYETASNRAAIDVGWLLKMVLSEDKEHIYEEIKGYRKSYIRLD